MAPALVVCTDGKKVGAILDRNGLRPFRYSVTKDGTLIMGSETGLVDIDDEQIEYRERLRPGRMFLIDFDEGRIIQDEEIKESLANSNPYSEWLDKNSISSKDFKKDKSEKLNSFFDKYATSFRIHSRGLKASYRAYVKIFKGSCWVNG